MNDLKLDLHVKRWAGEMVFQVFILQAENEELKRELEFMKVKLAEAMKPSVEKKNEQ